METLAKELETVYERCGKRFYACALAITACGGLAEDAVHNAFHRTLQLERRPDNLQAYLFRSVRNAAIDLMRKQDRVVPLTAEMVFERPPTQEAQAERAEFLERVTDELANLTTDERETILEHLVADLTFQEIATLRDRPMGTITSWYRRGLQKLKDKLGHEEGFI
jgi:RNA polymerase sigma-70 factor (ECF subfamily)